MGAVTHPMSEREREKKLLLLPGKGLGVGEVGVPAHSPSAISQESLVPGGGFGHPDYL